MLSLKIAIGFALKVLLIVTIAASVWLLLLVRLTFSQEIPRTTAPFNMRMHWIKYEGRNIEVYGYLNAQGKIIWEPGSPLNARPRERRDSPERLPTVTINGEPADPANRQGMPKQATPTNAQPAPSLDWATKGVMRPDKPVPVERFTADSPEAKRFVADVVEGPSEPKIHVTIIGNADERARVVNDIKSDPAFEGLRDGLLVQDYDPKEWPVKPELGFQAGKPAIIVQAAKGPNDKRGGRVIYRTLDYAIGAKGLAEAIRKADPSYDPDKDPGPDHKDNKKPLPIPPVPVQWTISREMLICIGGLVALLILTPNKKES